MKNEKKSAKKKDTKKKKIKLSWISIWLIAAASVLLVLVVYASYTGVSAVKRVVSTKAGSGMLFSSNYMSAETMYTNERGNYEDYCDPQGQPIQGLDPSYTLDVCNYAQGNKSSWYTFGNINYRLTAQLVKNEKNPSTDEYLPLSPAEFTGKRYGIGVKDGTIITFTDAEQVISLPSTTGTYTLSKNDIDFNEFTIVLDKSDLLNESPSVLLKITATPVNNGDLSPIVGYVGVCKRAMTDATWIGEIRDENHNDTPAEGQSAAVDTYDYAAYNYVISGNGKGKFYFAYDSTKLDPNKFFLQDNASIITGPRNVSSWDKYTRSMSGTSGWMEIVLNVDSSEKARYEIQLYKLSGSDYKNLIDDYVNYGFESESEGN